MTINLIKVKNYAALIMTGVIPVMFFAISNILYGFLYSIAFMLVGLLIGVIIGKVMLKNTFTAMLEGKGIIVINIDSTGIMQPFLVAVESPLIKGKIGNKSVNDVFDRDSVYNLAAPQVAEKKATPKDDGGISIDIDGKELNKGRFALFHFPCLIYNQQLGSILTKDFLSNQEKEAFAEHTAIYLNRKMEELTTAMRDFGRYVIETLKPAKSIFQNKFFWIVIAVAIFILIILFGKPMLQAVTNFGSGASSSIVGVGDSVITPRG